MKAGTSSIVGPSGPKPNGDVVYHTALYDHEVFRYRAGATEQLTSTADSLLNTFAVTDGINVVFTRGNSLSLGTAARHRAVLRRADGVEVELAGPRAQQPNYAVENGWAVFDLFDVGGVAQLYVRAPDGTITQATHATSSARIVALGPNGELAYESGGRRYVVVAPYTGTPVDIGSAWKHTYDEGRMEWRGGSLYAFLGRSAFVVSY